MDERIGGKLDIKLQLDTILGPMVWVNHFLMLKHSFAE